MAFVKITDKAGIEYIINTNHITRICGPNTSDTYTIQFITTNYNLWVQGESAKAILDAISKERFGE